MATSTTQHVPVLKNEILEFLDIQPADIVLDGTVGGGGHAEAFCAELGQEGTFIGLDQDTDALARTEHRLTGVTPRVYLREANFRNLDQVLDELEIAEVDKSLFDLGWSSDQIADPERGLSFQIEAPLTMTLKKNPGPMDITAFDVVNDWEESTIADILFAFGDERYARRIAAAIISVRKEEPIRTTTQLAQIVKDATPAKYHHGRIHPATRTFQGLRIVVNDEYGALKEMLAKVIDRTSSGGRIAVMSFHSGEDAIVKRIFKQYIQAESIEALHKKVITPTEQEAEANPRSRSAKLRVVQKK